MSWLNKDCVNRENTEYSDYDSDNMEYSIRGK